MTRCSWYPKKVLESKGYNRENIAQKVLEQNMGMKFIQAGFDMMYDDRCDLDGAVGTYVNRMKELINGAVEAMDKEKKSDNTPNGYIVVPEGGDPYERVEKVLSAYIDDHLSGDSLDFHILVDLEYKGDWESDSSWSRENMYVVYNTVSKEFVWMDDWCEGEDELRIYGITLLSEVSVPNNSAEVEQAVNTAFSEEAKE